MQKTNVEIKAYSSKLEQQRSILLAQGAVFKGIDHQIDTYFNIPNGRLKLRQGTIENYLIHYQRPNQAGPKVSDVQLYQPNHSDSLLNILGQSLGIKVVVDKKRAIYFIGNVKFHLDEVKGLGTFIEIEAIDSDGSITKESLHQQCQYYVTLLGIFNEELIQYSYSDLILRRS